MKANTTRTDLKLEQLTAELGGVGLSTRPVEWEDGQGNTVVGIEVEAHDDAITEQQLTDAIAAHVPNPDFGKPVEETNLKTEIAQRLQQLDDSTKTTTAWNGLTAAQRQEITRLAIQAFVKVVRFVAKRFL